MLILAGAGITVRRRLPHLVRHIDTAATPVEIADLVEGPAPASHAERRSGAKRTIVAAVYLFGNGMDVRFRFKLSYNIQPNDP